MSKNKNEYPTIPDLDEPPVELNVPTDIVFNFDGERKALDTENMRWFSPDLFVDE